MNAQLTDIEKRRLTRETDDGCKMVRRRPYRLTEFDYFEEEPQDGETV